jgi:hypothetical protein
VNVRFLLDENLDPRLKIAVLRLNPSMPDHIDAHLAMGGHFWGVCLLRDGFSIHRIAQELVLIAEASTIEEWLDRIEWIPF